MSRLIGSIFAGLIVLLLAAPLPAFAAPYADPAVLDTLFAQLKSAQSDQEAAAITSQIWEVWFTPNVPDLAEQMTKVELAMGAGELKTAKDTLDVVVKNYPDYAEGWNQRATLEYELDDFTDSLADIDKVLALEPRHFGALSGRVLIYLKQGRHAEALRDMVAALAIHPYLNEKQLFPELQQDVTHL